MIAGAAGYLSSLPYLGAGLLSGGTGEDVSTKTYGKWQRQPFKAAGTVSGDNQHDIVG